MRSPSEHTVAQCFSLKHVPEFWSITHLLPFVATPWLLSSNYSYIPFAILELQYRSPPGVDRAPSSRLIIRHSAVERHLAHPFCPFLYVKHLPVRKGSHDSSDDVRAYGIDLSIFRLFGDIKCSKRRGGPQGGALRRALQHHAALRAAQHQQPVLHLDQERHQRGGGLGPEGALQAGARRRRVRGGSQRGGRLRQLHVRAAGRGRRGRRGGRRAALGAARADLRQAAGRLQRSRGTEAKVAVQGGGQAVPARGVDVQQLERGGRRGRGGARGAGRARHAAAQRAGRGGRRAGGGGGAARGRGPVRVRGARARRARPAAAHRDHHAPRQGHVRRALALPRDLRRGVRALRHHPGLREAPHQARAGRLRHRQPRPEEVVSGAAAVRCGAAPGATSRRRRSKR